MNKTATVENHTVKVGDTVSFKSDVEQKGTISEIRPNYNEGYDLVLTSKTGFRGGYIGGQKVTTVHQDDCWI